MGFRPIGAYRLLPGRFAGLLAMLLIARAAPAATWRVSPDGNGDFITIGAAIAASQHDDLIEVEPGTYHERLYFGGRAITVRSTEGPEVTIIDGDFQGSVVVMDFLEGPNTVLDGFTLCHGLGTPVRAGATVAPDRGPRQREEQSGEAELRGRLGGGLLLLTAAPTLRNLIVRDNQAETGGGLFALQLDPHLQSCRFLKNVAGLGAGVYLEMTDGASFQHCEFESNRGVMGGGAALLQGSALFEECRFRANQASEGGALHLRDCAQTTVVRRSILDGNQGVDGSVAFAHGSVLRIEESTAAANGFPGEISTALLYREGALGAVSRSIVAVRRQDRPLRLDASEVTVDCSDLWAEGDPLSSPLGNNLAAPPGFCDEAAGDYRLQAGSPCLPENAPAGCGLIGALGLGCDPGPTGGRSE